MNTIDLHHLRSLVTLAEELNFGRAAERLHMSQPPLTRLLSETERQIGARLFERTTRRVRLTPVGEVFIAEARAVLARAEEAMESVRTAVRRQSGQLRLAYTARALQTVLPQLVAQLRERDHEVSIDLVELVSGAQKEALENGQVDAGFADQSIEVPGFSSLLLHQEALAVLLPGNHRLAQNPSLDLIDLAEETFILHNRQEYPGYYDRVAEACRQAGFTPRVYHREAQQNCMALVAAGQGVLLAPAKPHYPFAAGLHCVPLETAPAGLSAEIWAILPNTSTSPRQQALCEVIRASVP
jgi:DNA-binding transcriptional LysR family regulator